MVAAVVNTKHRDEIGINLDISSAFY